MTAPLASAPGERLRPHRRRRLALVLATHEGTSRIEALSDAVFAIAATLLVIELKIPRGRTDSARLLDALATQWPVYVGYVMSFVHLGIYWSHHVHVFRLFRRTDHVSLKLNVLFLMMIALIPFPTALRLRRLVPRRMVEPRRRRKPSAKKNAARIKVSVIVPVTGKATIRTPATIWNRALARGQEELAHRGFRTAWTPWRRPLTTSTLPMATAETSEATTGKRIARTSITKRAMPSPRNEPRFSCTVGASTNPNPKLVVRTGASELAHAGQVDVEDVAVIGLLDLDIGRERRARRLDHAGERVGAHEVADDAKRIEHAETIGSHPPLVIASAPMAVILRARRDEAPEPGARWSSGRCPGFQTMDNRPPWPPGGEIAERRCLRRLHP